MSEQRPYPSQEKQSGQTRWFSFLYRTRVMVHQGDIPIVNLSLAFALLVAVSAPWVAVAGLAVALALGYRIHVERNSPGFSGDFQQVVHDAAELGVNFIDTANMYEGYNRFAGSAGGKKSGTAIRPALFAYLPTACSSPKRAWCSGASACSRWGRY